MRAIVLTQINKDLVLQELPVPSPIEDSQLITIKAAAINHRDLYIQQGLYPGIKPPVILGSDGAGLTEEGKEVIINPAFDWGNNPNYPDPQFTILGLPKDGTFAEKVIIPNNQIYPKPPHLSWSESAALPLAGLTAYRALFTKGQLQAGQKVLISGVGGGVALFALQFALAAGAEVHVTSGSPEKREKALSIGAKAAYDYQTPNFGKAILQQSKGIDLVIDSAGGKGFPELVKSTAPGAKIILYGGTRGNISDLSPQVIFWKQLHIIGTSMGNDREFADMLHFVNAHQIIPIVDSIWNPEKINQAFEYINKGKQFGKVIMTHF